jgi:hypothetical protein
MTKETVSSLLRNSSGLKLRGVGNKKAWGSRQLASKDLLEKQHKAEVEAAYQRGWQDREEAFKRKLDIK